MPSPTLVSVSIDVLVPLPLVTKWVAYACRTAGVAKPKWHAVHELWTTTAASPEDGVHEQITIVALPDGAVRVRVAWEGDETQPRQTHTARRIVSALVTSMQSTIRRRNADESGTYAVSSSLASGSRQRGSAP